MGITEWGSRRDHGDPVCKNELNKLFFESRPWVRESAPVSLFEGAAVLVLMLVALRQPCATGEDIDS